MKYIIPILQMEKQRHLACTGCPAHMHLACTRMAQDSCPCTFPITSPAFIQFNLVALVHSPKWVWPLCLTFSSIQALFCPRRKKGPGWKGEAAREDKDVRRPRSLWALGWGFGWLAGCGPLSRHTNHQLSAGVLTTKGLAAISVRTIPDS